MNQLSLSAADVTVNTKICACELQLRRPLTKPKNKTKQPNNQTTKQSDI